MHHGSGVDTGNAGRLSAPHGGTRCPNFRSDLDLLGDWVQLAAYPKSDARKSVMFKNLKARVGLFLAAVSAFVVGPVAAQTDVGTTVAAAIAEVNPQIVTVIGAMAAALMLIVAWALIRKAFSGR